MIQDYRFSYGVVLDLRKIGPSGLNALNSGINAEEEEIIDCARFVLM